MCTENRGFLCTSYASCTDMGDKSRGQGEFSHMSEWISVNDSLPDQEGDYLAIVICVRDFGMAHLPICRDNKGFCRFVEKKSKLCRFVIGKETGRPRWFDSCRCDIRFRAIVSHWRPLPEPPCSQVPLGIDGDIAGKHSPNDEHSLDSS
jgi:uncharacterized protein DUF551